MTGKNDQRNLRDDDAPRGRSTGHRPDIYQPTQNQRGEQERTPHPPYWRTGSRLLYERDFQRDAGGANRGRLDYGWERLYEGKGYDWRQHPAYGWERPGPWWRRGYGVGRPYYGWEQGWSAGENPSGPYAGRGPKQYRRRDDFIYEDVGEALTRHPGIDASEIEVRVSADIVTLTGTVDSRQTKRAVEDTLETVSGIKDVDNRLRVKAPEPHS